MGRLRSAVAHAVIYKSLIFGRLLDGEFKWPRKGKNNDKAHPPIHPTKHTDTLQGDDRRVYEFVSRRFLACCSEDALGEQTTVDIQIASEYFSTSGNVLFETLIV